MDFEIALYAWVRKFWETRCDRSLRKSKKPGHWLMNCKFTHKPTGWLFLRLSLLITFTSLRGQRFSDYSSGVY